MSDTPDIELKARDRILITAETQAQFPEGYNWVGSAPIIYGLDGDTVFITQIGYPYMFSISRELALRARADLLAKVERLEAEEGKDE